MLLFRIVSDSADDSLMSYNMGVDLVDAPRKLNKGANPTKPPNLRVIVARWRAMSAAFAACLARSQRNQTIHHQATQNG